MILCLCMCVCGDGGGGSEFSNYVCEKLNLENDDRT